MSAEEVQTNIGTATDDGGNAAPMSSRNWISLSALVLVIAMTVFAFLYVTAPPA